MCWCCVLFFKQKTAYEMRISDWSSDVCSSDLFDLPEQPAGRGISAFAKQAGVQIIASQMLVRSKRTNRVVGNYGVDEGLRILQIGRASCRERVCQYV